MNKFDQSDINHFTSFFKDFSGQTGWIIKINGRTVKLNSGKSLWRTKQHAKSALKNHVSDFRDAECFLRKLIIKYLGKEYHPDDHQLWLNFLAFAEEKGIVEFVELK
jgi:hypothetical protein